MQNYSAPGFSKAELERYSRHLVIPQLGVEGQRKLKQSKVLVIGAGGLGGPMLQYLAAAGVGTIGIVDHDVVEESNLQRQVLFSTADTGQKKVKIAKKRLQQLNPHISLHTYDTAFTSKNALDIIRDKDYQVVADGTDNFPTRYLVNDACVLQGIPNVYASVFRFEGQLSVFNYTDSEGSTGPNYRDLFPTPPPPESVPNCAEGGVIGVLPGILGSLQANEVIKVVTGIGEPLSGKLFIFNALNFETRTVTIKKQPDSAEISTLIDYEQFCGVTSSAPDNSSTQEKYNAMKEITPKELKEKIDNDEKLQIIDVREKYEYDIVNIGGELIPLHEILQNKDKLKKDRPVILHCRSGSRSAQAIKALEQRHDFDNLYNLKGGILAYARQVDNSLPTY